MSDYNSQNNRAVWFDIPVSNLERASSFYASVLDIKVDVEKFDDFSFRILEHEDSIGGCLVPNEAEISSTQGILLYLNVDGRIKDAVAKVMSNGGKILEPTNAIGPHGFRAIICDSEGNRLVLHSNTDA